MGDQERQPLLIKTKRPVTLYEDTIQVDVYTPEDSFIDSHMLNSSRVLYDDIENEHGMRWRYDDYTTIDWIHDTIKDRKRVRIIKSLAGFQGKFIKYWDASQAWIILVMVGILSGIVASLMDILIPKLEAVKNCFQSEYCRELFQGYNLDHFGFVYYVCFGLIFAIGSTLLVSLSPHHQIVARDFGNPEQILQPSPEVQVDNRAPLLGGQVSPIVATSPTGLRNRNSIDYINGIPATKKIKRTLYHAAGSGIPEVKTILGGFVIRGYLGLKTLLLKIISLIFCISSGLMVGVQGPLVHIACSIGNVLSRMFIKYSKNEAKRREIMSASCAAGVSVAFGAPIGGVLFSLEEVSFYFPPKTMWRAFFCALSAAVTLKLIDPLGTGKLVMFQVSYDTDWNLLELIPFLFLGAFGGLYGAVFIKITSWLEKVKSKWKRVKHFAIIEVAVISVVTSTLVFTSDFTKMSNTVFVAELFNECKPDRVGTGPSLCNFHDPKSLILELGLAFLIKAFLMIITFGIRVPGGIFIPSMVVGACFGRIVGVIVQNLGM